MNDKNKEPQLPPATGTPNRKKSSTRNKKGNRCKENLPPKVIKDESASNHKITEYFQVRKSTRKTKSQIEVCLLVIRHVYLLLLGQSCIN